MKFRIIYGGQQDIEADSEDEAYEKFHAWCRMMLDQKEFGLAYSVGNGKEKEP